MSLIFQALHRLETEGAAITGLNQTSEQMQPDQQLIRPVYWWLLAVVLGAATITMAFSMDLPSRIKFVIASPEKTMAVRPSARKLQVAAKQSLANTGQSVKSPQHQDTVIKKKIEALPSLVIAKEQRKTALIVKTATVGVTKSAQPTVSATQRSQFYPAIIKNNTSAQVKQVKTPVLASPSIIENNSTDKSNLLVKTDHKQTQDVDGILQQSANTKSPKAPNSVKLSNMTNATVSSDPQISFTTVIKTEKNKKIPQGGESGKALVTSSTKSPVVVKSASRPLPLMSDKASNNLTGDVTQQNEQQMFEADNRLRKRKQTSLRRQGEQISRLTSELTHAVQANRKADSTRILAAMESSLGKDSNYVLNMRAYAALAHGQYKEVEKILSQVLARDSNNVSASLNMAVAESRTGRLQQARQRLENLVITHPQDNRVVAMLQSLPRQ